MNRRDTEFFAGIPYYVVKNYLRKRDFKFRPKTYIRRFGRAGGGSIPSTYRLASQIYAAQAIGIRKFDENAELFGTTPEIVKYAVDNKQKIAPKIIKAFRIAKEDPTYSKPYDPHMPYRKAA